jgi:Flp pilus assembly protein TadG
LRERIRKIRRRLRLRRLARSERGTQLVELAIVIPVLLLLFGGAAEFGRYFYEYTTLAKATRVGARYLITAANKSSEDTVAKNLVVYGTTDGSGTPILSGLTTANVTIVRTGPVPSVPQTITVQITGFKHQPIIDLGALLKSQSLSLNVDVKPSVTMRYLLTTPLI